MFSSRTYLYSRLEPLAFGASLIKRSKSVQNRSQTGATDTENVGRETSSMSHLKHQTTVISLLVAALLHPNSGFAKSFRELKIKHHPETSTDTPDTVVAPKKKKTRSRKKTSTSAHVDSDEFVSRAPASAKPSRSAVIETHAESPVPESPQEEETRLTKNWGGARKSLSDRGLDLSLVYKGEYTSVLSGGLRTGNEYLGNLDLRVSLDLDKSVGWKGGSLFLYGLGNHGGNPSKIVGDAQLTSNIETNADTFKLYEAWFQQFVYEERLSVLVGLHDLNSEFYVTDSSGMFLHSTFGVGLELSQTGVNGSSVFPATAPCLRLRAEPSKSFYLETALFNAHSGLVSEPHGTQVRMASGDGLLAITEAAYLRGKEDSQQLPAKYGLGYWTYTRTFDHWTSKPEGSADALQGISNGFYLLADQGITEWASVFFRYGVASTTVNRFGSSLATGFLLTGIIPHRSKDQFGFGIAQATQGNEYKDSQTAQDIAVLDSETTYELSYRINVIPGVAIQPDFQYVVHPSADPSIPNAKVGTLRFELSF